MLNGDFVLHRQVFDVPEQKILLSASLDKLNQTEGKQYRKRRKQYYDTTPPLSSSSTIRDLFLPEDYYDFQQVSTELQARFIFERFMVKQGHYDGVIKNFREMHVGSWSHGTPGLQHLLHRIRQFHPDEETQTHLLHLASDGDIQPHVDHLSAFGSWIVGISLGANRIMRLEKVVPGGTPPIDIILPSGSLYLQKYDSSSFDYDHTCFDIPHQKCSPL
jgi:alkylated DNA repair protein alkB family protein 7